MHLVEEPQILGSPYQFQSARRRGTRDLCSPGGGNWN